MSTNIERISKRKRLFYSYKEILDLYNELSNIELSSLRDIEGRKDYPSFKSNDIVKKLVENFYTGYFDQDFEVLRRMGDNIFAISNVFDLPIEYNDEDNSHITIYNYLPNDSLILKAFSEITINDKNNITTAIEYVHEIAHALTERNGVVDDEFLGELAPILLELLFAYDIDTDKNNYTNGQLSNNYNIYSIRNDDYDEPYNYETTRSQIKMRLDIVDILNELYKSENSFESLNKYSIYYQSTVTAIELFDSFINGNVSLLGYLDDLLKGHITVTEMVKEVKEYDEKLKKGYSK